MYHRKKCRKIGRTSSHRKAVLRNMAISLFEKSKVTTTLSISKELRKIIENLITLGKRGNYAQVANFISDKEAFKKIREVVLKYEGKNGGYTRIIKVGTRKGDGASLSIIELVD